MKVTMNLFIEKELNKCIIAKPQKVSDISFIINKIDNQSTLTDLEVGHFYIIEVEDYIIHPYDGFTLHNNWNNGVIPTTRKMQAEVIQIMGKMIKVNARCEDGLLWVGWLPRKSITIKTVIL